MKKSLSILLLAAACAVAQTAAPSYKDLKYPALRPIPIPPVATFTLPNGMKVYLLEDHELPLVHGLARVRTGNLFDPAAKIGLATITGMVMRTGGTKAKSGEELDVELENVAASVESDIGETSGSVTFSALKENADKVLGDFHDVLTSPEFRQDKVDLAKSQMRSSIARRNDDAPAISQREFANIIYGTDTPYGWEEQYATVDRIQRADLQGFYQRYYFPANVMLAVWGDFQTADMKAKLEKLFSDWTVKRDPVPPFPKVREAAVPGTYLAVKKDVTQTFFAMGELGGEFRDKDFPALEIMSDILGGGFQSRLFKEVRTRMGNAYAISATWNGNYDHPGTFEISGSTKAASTVETLRAIEREVERIRTEEVSPEELQSAKDTALNSLVFAFDTREKTLRRMLTYEYFGYPRDFIQQYQKALALVTRADVLRVAKQRLTPENFAVVAVGNPDDFGQPLEALGRPVAPIDLTIPEPQKEPTKADAASLEAGKRLLARAQEAAGGVRRLAEVKDYTQEAEYQLDPAAGGMRVKETDRWLAPAYFRQDSELPNGKIAAFTNGSNGWIATPQGAGALAGSQLQQVRGDLFRLYFRVLLSDHAAGRTISASEDNTVEIDGEDGQSVSLFFDPATGLLSKAMYESAQVAGPPMQVEDDYSDYREVNGLKVPFQIAIMQSGRKFADVKVTECRINTGLQLSDLEKKP